MHAGIPPPWEQTSPQIRHRLDQTPPEQTSPRQEQTPPAEHAGRYGQRAGGTYPTGMQSCLVVSVMGEMTTSITRLLSLSTLTIHPVGSELHSDYPLL